MMNNNTRRSSESIWEVANISTSEHSAFLAGDEEGAAGARAAVEDPLVFVDEPNDENNGEMEEEDVLVVKKQQKYRHPAGTATTGTKRGPLLVLILILLVLIFIIPIIILTVDRKQSEKRLKTNPDAFDFGAVEIDVSQSVPVVGIEISVLQSALPKFTYLNPQSLECELFKPEEWGNTLVASIRELNSHTSARRKFYVEATLVNPPPTNDEEGILLQDVTEKYASMAWFILMGKVTFISDYSCYLHTEAKVFGNMITWQHVEDLHGRIKLPESMRTKNKAPQQQTTGNGVVGSTGGRYGSTTSQTSNTGTRGWVILDNTEGTSSEEQQEQLPYYDYQGQQVVAGEQGGASTTSNTNNTNYYYKTNPLEDYNSQQQPQPQDNYYYNDDNVDTTPLVVYNSQQQQEDNAIVTTTTTTATTTPSAPFIVLHEITANGVSFGIRLPKLPKTIMDIFPLIQIKLPQITLQVQATNNNPAKANAQTITLDAMNLQFTSTTPNQDDDDQYALAQVGCTTTAASSSDSSCPWYNPSVNLLSDTFGMNSQQGHTVVGINIDANNSFLEQIVGSYHQIFLYKIQMEHSYYHNHYSSSGRRRRLQGNTRLKVDCIKAQDVLFGDIFALSLCLNLQYATGIAMDGYLNFYGYGGEASGEMLWKQDGNILSLDGSGNVDLQLNNNGDDDDEENKMDLKGSATLDLDQLSVAVYANNTGPWMPFRFIWEANVEYLDPQDSVVLHFNNLTLDWDGEQKVHSTGNITLNNLDSKISMDILDPRLEVAFDGSLLEDNSEYGLQATYKIVYDGENIMTGETTLTAPQCSTDGFYSLDDDSLIDQVTVAVGQVQTVLNPCDGSGKIKLESSSSGMLTSSFTADISARDYEWKLDMEEAKYQWDGEQIADATMSMVINSESGSSYNFLFVEKVQDHKITFTYEMAGDNQFDVTSETAVKLFGEELYLSKFKMKTVEGQPGTLLKLKIEEASYKLFEEWLYKVKGTLVIKEPDENGKYEGSLKLDGEALSRTFELVIEGDVASTPDALVEANIDSSLSVDDALVWSEKGSFVLTNPLDTYDYEGTLQMEPTKEPEVKMNTQLTCKWTDEDGTFSCELPQMTLKTTEDLITDSTGDMVLDVQGKSLSLDVKDDFAEDSNGYVVSISGSFEDDIVTAMAKEIKLVEDGETTRDASGRMEINLDALSMSYALADLVSSTLFSMQKGGIEMVYNEWTDLESFDIVVDGMNMVMEGDPWVHGGNFNFGISMASPATISISIDNNETSKFPLDIDWSLGIGSEEMTMQASVVYSPPPAPPTPTPVADSDDTTRVEIKNTVLTYNLEGLKAEDLMKPENAAKLEEAFELFVKDLLQSLREDDGSSTATAVTKGLGTRRRRLAVALLADTTQILRVVDVECPADAPEKASCQEIDGSYTLEVINENPAAVREKYIRETDKAIEEGKFADSLKEADKEFPVVVIGPVTKSSSPETAIPILGTVAPTSAASQNINAAWMATVWAASFLLL